LNSLTFPQLKFVWVLIFLHFVCDQGINRERVEQMEARLKEDILNEAARYIYLWFLSVFISNLYFPTILISKWHNRYGNKILVTDELPDGQMVDQWESVSSNAVKTPLEVWGKLVCSGCVRLFSQFSEQNAAKLFSWL
jgi:hypothetical protein